MKGNARLQLCAFIPWQGCDLNLALKIQTSYRQEELKRLDDNSKNKGVMWLYHRFQGVDQMDLTTMDALCRGEPYAKAGWNQIVECLKYKKGGYYLMGIVKSLRVTSYESIRW